jgi:hypothetical protein
VQQKRMRPASASAETPMGEERLTYTLSEAAPLLGISRGAGLRSRPPGRITGVPDRPPDARSPVGAAAAARVPGGVQLCLQPAQGRSVAVKLEEIPVDPHLPCPPDASVRRMLTGLSYYARSGRPPAWSGRAVRCRCQAAASRTSVLYEASVFRRLNGCVSADDGEALCGSPFPQVAANRRGGVVRSLLRPYAKRQTRGFVEHILTMNPAVTAVRTSVSAGRLRPSGVKVGVLVEGAMTSKHAASSS